MGGFVEEAALTRKQFERALCVWQRRLGLERWEIVVRWDEPHDGDTVAEMTPEASYDRGFLRLNRSWASWSSDYANRTIVHELLHLLTRDLDGVVAAIDGAVHRDVYAQIDKRYDHEIEGFVDRLACRLVEIAGVV